MILNNINRNKAYALCQATAFKKKREEVGLFGHSGVC